MLEETILSSDVCQRPIWDDTTVEAPQLLLPRENRHIIHIHTVLEDIFMLYA